MSTNNGSLIEKYLSIKKENLIKLSFYLLAIWLMGPIIAIAINLTGVSGWIIYKIWSMLVYLCGGFGWLIGVSYLYQSTYEALSSERLNKKDVVNAYLPLIVLFAFWVWCIVCSLQPGVDFYFAFIGSMPMLNTVFVYFLMMGFALVSLIISQDRDTTIKTANLFIAVAAFLSITTIPNTSLSYKLNFVSFQTITTEYTSIFANLNHFGYYLTVAILATYFMIMFSHSLKKRIIYTAIFALLISMLVLNNTMGAHVACLLVMIFVVIWKFINKENDKLIPVILFALYIGVCLLSKIYTDNFYSSVLSMFGDISILGDFAGGNLEESEMYSIGSSRGVLWAKAVKSIRHNPIFGSGMQHAGYYGPPEKVHNGFLEIAVYTGLPGLLLYCATFVIGAVRMLKKRKTIDAVSKAAGFVLIGYLISDFFGVQEFYTTPYLLISLGFCLKTCMNDLILEKKPSVL